MLTRLLGGFVGAFKATLSQPVAASIGKITRTCPNAQSAQNYLVLVGWLGPRKAGRYGDLDQAELPRLLDGRGPALDSELAVDAPQMPANSAGADVEGLGHLGVGESPSDERENL